MAGRQLMMATDRARAPDLLSAQGLAGALISKTHLRGQLYDPVGNGLKKLSRCINWMAVGEAQTGDQLPPWDRSIRVGLTAGGAENMVARFDSFQMHSVSTEGRTKR